MTKKQNPLTYELFQELIMPELKNLIVESKDELDEKISHLPTKKEYYESEDKTMTELKSLRDEVAATGSLYEKTNKRIDIIDKNLSIDTSVVF